MMCSLYKWGQQCSNASIEICHYLETLVTPQLPYCKAQRPTSWYLKIKQIFMEDTYQTVPPSSTGVSLNLLVPVHPVNDSWHLLRTQPWWIYKAFQWQVSWHARGITSTVLSILGSKEQVCTTQFWTSCQLMGRWTWFELGWNWTHW